MLVLEQSVTPWPLFPLLPITPRPALPASSAIREALRAVSSTNQPHCGLSSHAGRPGSAATAGGDLDQMSGAAGSWERCDLHPKMTSASSSLCSSPPAPGDSGQTSTFPPKSLHERGGGTQQTGAAEEQRDGYQPTSANSRGTLDVWIL